MKIHIPFSFKDNQKYLQFDFILTEASHKPFCSSSQKMKFWYATMLLGIEHSQNKKNQNKSLCMQSTNTNKHVWDCNKGINNICRVANTKIVVMLQHLILQIFFSFKEKYFHGTMYS